MGAAVKDEGEARRRELTALAVRRWGIDAPQGGDAGDYAWILGELTERIHHLLKYQPAKLMNTLYILDVSEGRYKAAMAGATLAEQAARLAQVVLERESEKMAMRARYRGGEAASGELPDEGRG